MKAGRTKSEEDMAYVERVDGHHPKIIADMAVNLFVPPVV